MGETRDPRGILAININAPFQDPEVAILTVPGRSLESLETPWWKDSLEIKKSVFPILPPDPL